MKAAGVGLFLGWLLASGLAVAQPAETPITEEARQHFAAGVNLLQDPEGARYEEAYQEFKAAYAASPSWKILGNLGIAAMKLERDGEAIDAFTKYLAAGGETLDEQERQQFESDLATLKTAVVTLTLSTNPPGADIVDERVPVKGSSITNRYGAADGPLTVGIRPGHHRITAKLAGRADAVFEFDAPPGGKVEHVIELAPVPVAGPPIEGTADSGVERPLSLPVYIGIGVTGACLIGAGVTGVLALGKKSDYDAANDGTDVKKAGDLRSSTQSLNLVSDIFTGATVVGAVVTTLLYLNRPEVPRQARSVRVEPVIGSREAAVVLNGSF